MNEKEECSFNKNIFNISEQYEQEFPASERHPVLTDEEKYYFEKQVFLSMLCGERSTNCIQPPSLQELSILSYGVNKLIDQKKICRHNSYLNYSSTDLINSDSMPHILCFFSKYLNNRSPVDCARIWKFIQGRKEIFPNESDFDQTQTPETSTIIKYRKNSGVYVNKNKIAFSRKKEIMIGSLESKNKKVVNIPEASLLVPYIDLFAALTQDGKIYSITANNDEQPEHELLLNAEKPLSDLRISQTITPVVSALSNDSQNIIFGREQSYKEFKFTDKIIQHQINESNLCFSTKSSFYVLDSDRINSSYEYSKNMNDFKIFRNELIVLAYGDKGYDIFDMRTPDRIFNSSFKAENNILDCQLSPLNNLFSFTHQSLCSIFDFRNPNRALTSFQISQSKDSSCKIKWIGNDHLMAVACDSGVYNLVNILHESAQILKSYTLLPGNILDLNTTDDTVIITQPNIVSIYQMNTRPILLPNFT